MRKILAAGLAGLFLAAGVANANADAVPALSIVRVGYNAAGADTATNVWQEYVDIYNASGKAVDVAGWAVYDAWAWEHRKDNPAGCNTITFRKATGPRDAGGFQHLGSDNPDTKDEETKGLWLPKGEYIRVYTGGEPDTTVNNWHSVAINKPKCGYQGHYLNNAGDTVRLVDVDGKVVDEFTYDFRGGYYVR